MKTLLMAVLALAFVPVCKPIPTPTTFEALGGLAVPLQGFVAPIPVEIVKADPHYDAAGKPTRLPKAVYISGPAVADGRFTLSNPHDEPGQRVINYAGGGWEFWTPYESARWMRENGTAEFLPGSHPHDADTPTAQLFVYSQGPYNGYSGAHGQPLGPNCVRTTLPGQVEIDRKVEHGWAVFRITDPKVLRSILLPLGEDPGATSTWHYQRTFRYRTTSLPPVVTPYIPIRFNSGTYDPSQFGPPAGILVQVEWKSVPASGVSAPGGG